MQTNFVESRRLSEEGENAEGTLYHCLKAFP